MHQLFIDTLLENTKGKTFEFVEEIQSLWSGYGSISRYRIIEGEVDFVVVKHVKIPNSVNHPRGWGSDIGHQRKVKSYQVETAWYKDYSKKVNQSCKVPKCYAFEEFEDEVFIVLEDLDASGFNQRLLEPDWAGVESCLKWLANFHAQFLDVKPEGLWEVGTYWHLETRPEELSALADASLKDNASKIDYLLNTAKYQTLVHGDAKLANFCFSENHKKVAAVDFQYIGSGIGMKDLVYFIGSCFMEEDCKKLESELLGVYFEEFKAALAVYHPEINPHVVEQEWRTLFDVAWADFHRFMKGWSPSHWKINSYSEVLTAQVLNRIKHDLSPSELIELKAVVEDVSVKAGEIIERRKTEGFQVNQKTAGDSVASQIVTEIDKEVENYILSDLNARTDMYDFGVLTEEQVDDGSRFEKPYFWCIDPLDGTLPFVEGKEGYSVSIALVSKSGESVLGVVFDPINDVLYSAIKGMGASKNGVPFYKTKPDSGEYTLVIDRSFFGSEEEIVVVRDFENQYGKLHIKNIGGAVMNALWVVENQASSYFKPAKPKKGGGSIWDFAATSCICNEAGLKVTDSFGDFLFLNNPNTTFMNRKGVVYK